MPVHWIAVWTAARQMFNWEEKYPVTGYGEWESPYSWCGNGNAGILYLEPGCGFSYNPSSVMTELII